MNNSASALLLLALAAAGAAAQAASNGRESSRPAVALPNTALYVDESDLPDRVLTGVTEFLRQQTDASLENRHRHWARAYSSTEAYGHSVVPNRERFRRIIGLVDERLPVDALEYVASTAGPATVLETDRYSVHRVRWPVLEGVSGEGLLVRPQGPPTARIVALPDADQTPEMLLGLVPGISPASQFARRLAERGCEIIIPVLVSRSDAWSGNPRLPRYTNQPHREWIYRQAYQMGRHIIGYEVQKILAALDWFERERAVHGGSGSREAARIGVVGYGEGGLLAFYTAAVDERIDVALISGYFTSRQRLWAEPIYRNVFGLLDEFGDAEIASLVAPRRLLIEPSHPPRVDGPPAPRDGRRGAAPGRIHPAQLAEIRTEVSRAQHLAGRLASAIQLVPPAAEEPVAFGSVPAVDAFIDALQITSRPAELAAITGQVWTGDLQIEERQRRQVKELEDFTQKLIVLGDADRAQFFWQKLEARVAAEKGAPPAHSWQRATREYKEHLWNEVIGRLPPATLPPNPRTRMFRQEPKWTGYTVVLDVWPGVITWGYLLVPNDLRPEERRPAVVCQHGISGTPDSTLDPSSSAYGGFATKLAEEGFVVFSAYNPNRARGHERFLDLQRLGHPIKRSIFSVILGQHDRVLDFLSDLPFVDPARIGFYGLSYGGKTAMRVPALLDRYALSICSGDFNEWIRKTITVHAVTNAAASAYRFSGYMFTGEYEIYEFNLGRTFNYAEMAALIAPRPFMVERGHGDLVGADEWVAYEYAKVFRLYNSILKQPERTALEVFDGGHQIHAQGTFEFLRRHLQWPRTPK